MDISKKNNLAKKSNSTKTVDCLLTWAVEDIIDKNKLVDKLKSGKKLRVKLGIDPTGKNIHLGRAVVLWKLRHFQEAGHKIVLVIGDFTAQIGDPSDKLSKRPFLSPEQIKKNLVDYKKQLGKILDLKKVEWCYNGAWLKKMTFAEVCYLAESFSVQQMLARRNFKDRYEKGEEISLREFLYPLMQGYDSVKIKADLELGGFDQLFNLQAGRVIQPLYKQAAQDIMVTSMLEGTDGRKMSTSWGNVININDDPQNMYGKAMAIKDELIVKYLELTTQLPNEEISKLEQELSKGVNPKIIKTKLAFELVKLYCGEKEAQKAAAEFESVHAQGNLPNSIKSLPIPQNTNAGMVLVEVVHYLGLVASKAEARRLIEQGGVRVSGEVIKNWQTKITPKSGLVVQVGSRRFAQFK